MIYLLFTLTVPLFAGNTLYFAARYISVATYIFNFRCKLSIDHWAQFGGIFIYMAACLLKGCHWDAVLVLLACRMILGAVSPCRSGKEK